MKFKSFLCMAAAGLMLASCQNNSATGAGSASEAAKADSLMYYFGQFRGIEYKRTAETDTTLSSEDARHEYLRGVQAGLNAVKAGNEAYNQGVSLGMQMAMNMAQFSDDYGVKLSNRGFLKGLREALESDSVADQNEMQKEFYRILGEFNTAKENRDKEAATAALVKEAGDKKLSKITDNLYGSVGNAQGEKLKAGDKVDLKIKITTADGKEVNAPLPGQIQVREKSDDNPLNDALLSLSSGQTGTFMTTAQALFGQRSSQLNLKPEDVLNIEMTPTVAAQTEKAE